MTIGVSQPIVRTSPLAYLEEDFIRNGKLALAKFTQEVQDAIASGGLSEAQVAAYLIAQHYTTESRVNTLITNAIGSVPSGSSPAYLVYNLDGARKNIRFHIAGETPTTPADNLLIDEASVNGSDVLITGETTASSLHVVFDTQGGSTNYNSLKFVIENQTNIAITQWLVASGGGDGDHVISSSNDVNPGGKALVTVTPDSTSITDGLAVNVINLDSSIDGLFDNLNPVAASLDEEIVFGDVSDNNKSRKISIRDLKALIGTSQLTHIRRSAIRATDSQPFTVGNFTNVATATFGSSHLLQVPAWDDGDRQLAFAVPSDTPDLTGIYPNGVRLFNAIESFPKASYVLEIDRISYKVFVNENVFIASSGQTFELEP